MTAPRAFLPVTRRYAAALDRVRRATPRERLMLAGLAVVGALILVSSRHPVFERQASPTTWREVTPAARDRSAPPFSSRNAPQVGKALAEKSAKLAGRRMSASDLLAAVDTLARESGLNADSTTPRSDHSGGLTFHLLRAKSQPARAHRCKNSWTLTTELRLPLRRVHGLRHRARHRRLARRARASSPPFTNDPLLPTFPNDRRCVSSAPRRPRRPGRARSSRPLLAQDAPPSPHARRPLRPGRSSPRRIPSGVSPSWTTRRRKSRRAAGENHRPHRPAPAQDLPATKFNFSSGRELTRREGRRPRSRACSRR